MQGMAKLTNIARVRSSPFLKRGRSRLGWMAGVAALALGGAPCDAVAGEPHATTQLQLVQDSQPATISIAEAMERAQSRFVGQIIEAVLDTGRPHEKTDVVFELRMLTQRGDILKIRVDARDGSILEVDGRGLVDARRIQ
jgi:hypothetical protein